MLASMLGLVLFCRTKWNGTEQGFAQVGHSKFVFLNLNIEVEEEEEEEEEEEASHV